MSSSSPPTDRNLSSGKDRIQVNPAYKNHGGQVGGASPAGPDLGFGEHVAWGAQDSHTEWYRSKPRSRRSRL